MQLQKYVMGKKELIGKECFAISVWTLKNHFKHTHTRTHMDTHTQSIFQEMHLQFDAACRNSTLKVYLLLMVMCVCNGWQKRIVFL